MLLNMLLKLVESTKHFLNVEFELHLASCLIFKVRYHSAYRVWQQHVVEICKVRITFGKLWDSLGIQHIMCGKEDKLWAK